MRACESIWTACLDLRCQWKTRSTSRKKAALRVKTLLPQGLIYCVRMLHLVGERKLGCFVLHVLCPPQVTVYSSIIKPETWLLWDVCDNVLPENPATEGFEGTCSRLSLKLKPNSIKNETVNALSRACLPCNLLVLKSILARRIKWFS